ncbi:PREDICTED: uncharacterized protein LOC104819637 [Tarenaya hassleriana]|uniref:uncharacterized protein LOC104819637 n=1 Tax=Tarenaya hassleriana TaxID=28532 RepID=UPI00053C82B6|nr:PREDICTED: uncharacterized protein LOC104819637 [Tarenaya hassleriana]
MAETGGASIPPLPSVEEIIPHRFLSLEERSSSRTNQESKIKRKLEDYLDPFILRAISSTIAPSAAEEEERAETKKKKKKKKKCVLANADLRTEFDWPLHRLDPLLGDPKRDHVEKTPVKR